MKRIFPLLLLFAAVSCNDGNKIEEALKDYVIKGSENLASESKLDYKLISFEVLDTITNREFLDSLSFELNNDARLWDNPSKDSLTRLKDMKFPSYITKNKEVYSSIEEQFHIIDSLASIWDKVTPYSYQLNLVPQVLKAYQAAAYDVELSETFERHFAATQEMESVYNQADSVYKEDMEDIYAYKIIHNYSINNVLLGKRVEISHLVYLDKNLYLKSSSVLNSFEDMIKQISE